MDYDKIILEMLDRIKTLENQVAELSGAPIAAKTGKKEKTSKKYRRLTYLLEAANGMPVTLTFAEIEKTVGFRLPASARKHRAFWANTTTHSFALSWLSAGYRTVDIDIGAETVVFER